MAAAELTCARCGAQFHSPIKRGRPPKYCGESCRTTAKSVRTPKQTQPCIIDGCENNAITAGLCTKHYQRKRAYGDPAAPAMVTKPCEYCGADFVGRRARRWCGWKCRSRSMGIKPLEVRLANAVCRQTHICQHCSAPFKPRNADRTSFCSRTCAFAHRTASAASSEELERRRKARAAAARKVFDRIPCRACGMSFTPQSGKHYYCSSACRSAHKTRADARPARCTDCGARCVVPKWQRARCDECAETRKVATRARQAERARVDGTNAAHRKARKLKQRGSQVETVNPIVVLSRDGWSCKLCGISTPKKLRGTYDDRAPEVDHIIPISQGGEHSYRNTQCACRKCNIAKGNKVIGQLRLFA